MHIASTPRDRAPRSVRREARPLLNGWHLAVPIVALAASRDLWAPDEPRYAEIAREAWESGEMLVLHLCGAVYPDKPPLVYWLTGLAGWLGGWSELALRLPSILATLGSAWIAQRMARRSLGDAVAGWTPTFYLGTALVLWFGGRLQLDSLLAFFCLAAVHLVWTEDEPLQHRRIWLAGVLTGLGALCKGPVAWLHVGLALVAMRCVPGVPRAVGRGRALAWTGFAALAILPVAAWATIASIREPSLWKPLFLGQHVGRAASVDAPHAGPPWEHAWQMPALVLPWTALFVLGLGAAWRAARDSRRVPSVSSPEQRFLARAFVWFALVFVVFSAMPPKRELYLLPIYPAAAWFTSVAFARALAVGRMPTWAALVTTGSVLVAGLGAAIAPRVAPKLEPYATATTPVALALAAGAIVALVALRRGHLARWADALSLGLSAAGIAAAIRLVPTVDPLKSSRTLAAEIAALPEKPTTIPCIAVQPEGYRYYGAVPTVRGAAADLESAAARSEDAFLALISARSWNALSDDVRASFRVELRREVGSREVLVIGAERR